MHPIEVIIEKIRDKEPWKPTFHGNQWTGGLGKKGKPAPKAQHEVSIWTYGDGKRVPKWRAKMFDHIEAATPPTSAEVARHKKIKASGQPNRIGRGSPTDRLNRKTWMLKYFGDGKTAHCVHCERTLTLDTITPDRIHPEKSYAHDNIVPACLSCNSAREDTSIWDFLGIDPG